MAIKSAIQNAESSDPDSSNAIRTVQKAGGSRRRESPGKLAMLMSGKGSPTRACRVLHLSQIGARLAVEMFAELPQKFILLLSPDGGLRRQCEVVWQSESAIGVRFCL